MAKSATRASTRAHWNRLLGPYQHADNRSAAWQLITTLLLFALTWYLMLQALSVGWWLTLLGAPVASLLLVRLFIIQHDCGHGSFFTSRKVPRSGRRSTQKVMSPRVRVHLSLITSAEPEKPSDSSIALARSTVTEGSRASSFSVRVFVRSEILGPL